MKLILTAAAIAAFAGNMALATPPQIFGQERENLMLTFELKSGTAYRVQFHNKRCDNVGNEAQLQRLGLKGLGLYANNYPGFICSVYPKRDCKGKPVDIKPQFALGYVVDENPFWHDAEHPEEMSIICRK